MYLTTFHLSLIMQQFLFVKLPMYKSQSQYKMDAVYLSTALDPLQIVN